MNSSFTTMNDFDSLVVVPVISLNPKKAKKKLKKAARSEENVCDSRLPVDKVTTGSIEVVSSLPLRTKVAPKLKQAIVSRPPLVEKQVMSAPQSESTPTLKFEGGKKSWSDITMDDDDDFCPQ